MSSLLPHSLPATSLSRSSKFSVKTPDPFAPIAVPPFPLGIAAISGANAAVAEPLPPAPAQTAQTAQPPQTPSPEKAGSSGDVVVDTDPQKPGTPTNPATTPDGTPGSSKGAGARFTCEYNSGQYLVMYHPESQPGQSYPWANPSTMGGGWTSAMRCNEISRRLETYRPDGLLEMRTGVENGYNTVCVMTQKIPACRIVLTVPPGQDPTMTRDRVFQNLSIADSGQRTVAVNTFMGGEQFSEIANTLGKLMNGNLPDLGGYVSNSAGSIDLRLYLDRADGGTGAQLQGGISNQSAPRWVSA